MCYYYSGVHIGVRLHGVVARNAGVRRLYGQFGGSMDQTQPPRERDGGLAKTLPNMMVMRQEAGMLVHDGTTDGQPRPHT